MSSYDTAVKTAKTARTAAIGIVGWIGYGYMAIPLLIWKIAKIPTTIGMSALSSVGLPIESLPGYGQWIIGTSMTLGFLCFVWHLVKKKFFSACCGSPATAGS